MSLNPKAKVSFFFDDVRFSLANRTALKKFIESVFLAEKKKCKSLNYVFCSDERLLQINRDFLRHDYYTDIITFDLTDDPVTDIPGGTVTGRAIAGEIYVSVDRVRDNAVEAGVSFTEELHRVIFHGVLHLCGYKDKRKVDILVMRERENFYLARYKEVRVR